VTSFEAVQVLSARARRLGQLAWVGGTIVLLLVFLGIVAEEVLRKGRLSKGTGTVAAVGTIAAAVVVLPSVRIGVRSVLRWRRRAWIEELARQEGLDAKTLAESFTIDSW
jgi:hypothetical protein